MGYRADIDGLRAIAILAVVAFHVGLCGAGGGYAGVDIFFVISGFLITRLLLVEKRETGRIDLPRFYARRIRRLAPAYAVVVIVTAILGFFVLLPTGEQESLGAWAIAASGFAANILGWRDQTGYFAPAGDYLPLIHLWTLAVEEQFYLVWPLIILAASAWARGRPSLRLPATFLALITLSLVAGLAAEKVLSAQAVFFLMPFRVWEFCAGALVAVAPLPSTPRPRLAAAAAAAGLGLIVLFAIFEAAPGQVAWPAKAAPVAGAALLIAAGSLASANPISRLLGTRPLVELGKLSYGWYLWHWPLLALARIVSGGGRDLAQDSVAAVAALGLAWFTFRLVEDPFHRRNIWPFDTDGRSFVAGAATLGLCAGLGGALWLWAQIPTADPKVAAAKATERVVGDSTGNLGAVASPRAVMIWGDSHARHLEPGLDRVARDLDLRLITRTQGGCAPHDNPRKDCQAFDADVAASIAGLARSEGLAGVVLAERWNETEYHGQLDERVRALRKLGLRVLLIEDGPLFDRIPATCYPRRSDGYCSVSRAKVEAERRVARQTLRAVAASDPGVRLFSLMDVLCNQSTCSPQRGGVLLYADLHHLSREGSLAIAPALAPHLRWVSGDNPPQLAH